MDSFISLVEGIAIYLPIPLIFSFYPRIAGMMK